MKIIFKLDEEYDFRMAFGMLRGKDWEYRARHMGLDDNLIQSIHNANPDNQGKVEQLLKAEVSKTYTKLMPFITKSKELYQQSWDEIIDDFSKTVEEITGPWFYEQYLVNVTHFNPGISNWNGNIVGRWWKENSDTQRRITAHELLLAHYFSIHRNMYKDSGLTDRQIWALAEISAWALTGLEDKLKIFWPWDTRGYYTDHNYPQFVNLQLELKEPYLKRKDFKEYIETGIELVQKYPEIH